VAFAGLLLAFGVPALHAQAVPKGIPVGRWILTPTFRTAYEVSDNVFYQIEPFASSDRVTRYQGRLGASMPFRNSMLDLEYGASKDTFDINSVPRDLRQQFRAEVTLNFKSSDRLVFRDMYLEDFARSETIDVGSEQVFAGQPYNVNRWEIELSRNDATRQGYLIRIRRQDFVYEGQEDISFFDYRGFDNVFEYRQPVPGNRSWIVRYEARRFKHYDPFQVLAPHGEPFRREKTDSFQLGLRGMLGEGQPYRIHLGYGSFEYVEAVNLSNFDGLVGAAAWRLHLGLRSVLELEAVRRALPSNFESYYVNNAVDARFEIEWLRTEAGTELEVVKNQYSGFREDDIIKFDLFWAWRVHERMKFEVSSVYAKRSSNVPFANYDALSVETAFSLGWF
jgi:hypothetical protein